jgi:hypothetical protein
MKNYECILLLLPIETVIHQKASIETSRRALFIMVYDMEKGYGGLPATMTTKKEKSMTFFTADVTPHLACLKYFKFPIISHILKLL